MKSIQSFWICFCVIVAVYTMMSNQTVSEENAPIAPLKVLMVTGGSSHDYDSQKTILAEGISKRANIEWTIAHQGGKDRNKKTELFSKPNWADGYDVVVHNICFGGVTDVKFIEQVAKAHHDGVPAVTIHCATHSFRNAKTDVWRLTLGVSSFSHEKHRPLKVRNVAAEHPIMKGFPKVWNTPNGELYKISKLWPNCKPLGIAYGEDTKKDHACIWTNTYGKGKIFGTTIGHHNETMRDPVFMDVVTRGLLWACDKLDEDGKPKPGYGPTSSKAPSLP